MPRCLICRTGILGCLGLGGDTFSVCVDLKAGDTVLKLGQASRVVRGHQGEDGAEGWIDGLNTLYLLGKQGIVETRQTPGGRSSGANSFWSNPGDTTILPV